MLCHAVPPLQISNNCGMLHYTSGGQFKVPVVVRGPGGVGRQLGAEHSQRLESYFQSIPGVQLVACSTVANSKALLKSVSHRHSLRELPALRKMT
jgi:pyruvate dehydrogenase E1 component beta subunit